MAFPILHRLLFGNDGAGPKLRSDILPTATTDTPGAVTTGDGITNTDGKLTVDFSAHALVPDAQTLTDAQKTQVRSNISAQGVGETVTVSGTSGDIIAARAKRTDTGRDVWFGVGESGTNRGIYDETTEKWLVYVSNANTYLISGFPVSAPKFVASSDRRLKTDLREIHPDLSSLKAYSYTLKTDGKKAYGLIAQDVQKVLPDAVTESTDADHHLVLDYNAIVAALVDEVNRLKARVAELEK